jgi:hypothetical protein
MRESGSSQDGTDKTVRTAAVNFITKTAPKEEIRDFFDVSCTSIAQIPSFFAVNLLHKYQP